MLRSVKPWGGGERETEDEGDLVEFLCKLPQPRKPRKNLGRRTRLDLGIIGEGQCNFLKSPKAFLP